MADGTVVVGVVAILTSGVLGPLVLHHANKERDSRDDQRKALDAATEPLMAARSQVAWLGMHGLEDLQDEEWDERLESLHRQLLLVGSHLLRLRMRFGDSVLASAYQAAGASLDQQAALQWDQRHQRIELQSEADKMWEKANSAFLDAYREFRVAAHRWHEDSHWPYGP